MSKLHDTEDKLIKVNDAVFQNICDAYLFFTEKEYPDLHRTGSQKGKQKTTKGTPDTYFKLKNGRYVLVEYTTKEKKDNKIAFIKKIKDDINKCLNEKVTGIKILMIQKIIFCHNSSLTIKESSTLIDFYKRKGVKLEFKDTHTIAMGLYGRCPHIAKDFLGIQIDTAQILTPQIFAQEYTVSGIATPLNNNFYFREEELKSLINSVNDNLITILTGAPGVGKSRLALAALENFKKNKKEKYTTYCISNKGTGIYDDLRAYLREEKNYLILIDDANRQLDHLMSLLSILGENRKGKVKIILTVRDYALEILTDKCFKFQPEVQNIKKLSDEQLKEILKSNDFKISNYDEQKRILEIADGNPRLAIMAAKVAKDSNSHFALHDVSDLYDKYFGLTLTDLKIFSDNTLLKTIGLLSFFHSIDRSNEKFMNDLYKNFKIDYYTFSEAIEKLERLELLETSLDMTVVKISEQVLSTYFFYKVFLKEKVLDFSVVLDHYFDAYNNRIRDTVIPANNTFGYDNVYKKLNPYLNDLWNKIKSNETVAIKFLELFWFYRSNNVFSFIYEKLENQPALNSPLFENDDDRASKIFNYNSDKYLDLLSRYLHQPSNDFVSALELSFEYVQKNPTSYTQFVKSFSDDLIFSYEDYRIGFYRQLEFLRQLKNNVKEKIHTTTFFDVIPKLMKTNYNITSSGRQRDTITWYHYDIPLNTPIKEFRKTVWEVLTNYYKKHSTKTIQFFNHYLQRSPDKNKDVLAYDLDFIVNIIEKHFNPKEFEHCYIVQDFLMLFTKMGIVHYKFKDLKSKFLNQQYKNYLVLSYNRLRDK